jgi:hypothetical protein
VYFDRHEADLVRNLFQQALRIDRSVATHHAARGAVEQVREDWEEAEAEYASDQLIDVNDQANHAQTKESLCHRD